MKPYYSWKHIVGFRETNLVGNVYFANHLIWQGSCREMFLKDNAPDILEDLKQGLALVTVRCSCDYLEELEAFDQIEIRMYLSANSQNQATMDFHYYRLREEAETLVAKGSQTIASMRRQNGVMVPTPLPASLKEALTLFS